MKVSRNDKYIEFSGDFTVLSSAPLNGGLTKADRVINHTTDPEEKGPIRDYFRENLPSLAGDLEGVVGLLTAVDVTTGFVSGKDLSEGSVKVMVTAGVGDPIDPRYHNTINIVIHTNINLSPTGMANLFIVVTEAKVAALNELEIIKNGKQITGTPTDAIAVAKPRTVTDRESAVNFSGRATELGREAYKLVKKGVRDSLAENNGYCPERSVLKRLAERGIGHEELLESAFSLLAGETGSRAELEDDFIEILERYSRDPNVHFLITSSFYLEKEKERFNLVEDPGRLVADEIIGIDIAEYIGGKNALFNFIRYDRKKPGILGDLPPFLDDAVGGLIAGVMTKLFESK